MPRLEKATVHHSFDYDEVEREEKSCPYYRRNYKSEQSCVNGELWKPIVNILLDLVHVYPKLRPKKGVDEIEENQIVIVLALYVERLFLFLHSLPE